MPPRHQKPKYPPKLIWLSAAAIAVAAVIIAGVIIHTKSGDAYATPQKAIEAAGLDTGGIKKVFTYSGLSAAVDIKPGENTVIYVCRFQNGKWHYKTSKTVSPDSGAPAPFIFSTDDTSANALCVVFADSANAAEMKLIASDAAVKQPFSSGTAGSLKFFAFGFDGARNDMKAYCVTEYNKDNQPLTSSDFKFSGGSFDITCNGTKYHYPVSTSGNIAAAFMARLNGSGLDFSAFNTKPDAADTFILTYTSEVHAVIRPANIKSGAVSYDKVTVQMPLDGSDNNLVYVSGGTHALIAHRSADALANEVMKLISGK